MNTDLNYALYFLAVGDSALECLGMAYASLRAAGFDGDVHIMADRDRMPFLVGPKTAVHKLDRKHLSLDEDAGGSYAFFDIRSVDRTNRRNERNPRKWSICRAKSLIDFYVPLDAYDYLIYLDVDVLVRGPMADLESYLREHEGSVITAQNSDTPRLGGRGNFSFRRLKRVRTACSANLTGLELIRHWFTPAICSDIICLPLPAGKEILSAWRQELLKNIDYDQPALQAVLLRKFKGMHRLAPNSLFGSGGTIRRYRNDPTDFDPPNSTFIHLQGAVNDPEFMRAYHNRYMHS